ncbi:MAG: DUF3795 domain-containing protein [Planctomycetes bacterium]|nr:DUF3795 domain-containing protein [Planctomycetota bacterium]
MSGESKEVVVAYCGLVCSDCGAYLKGRCQGCHCDKPMNKGCKVKPCAQERNCSTCGDCGGFENLKECDKLNNFISKIFAFIFRSDRIGNLNRIREIGIDRFKEEKQG